MASCRLIVVMVCCIEFCSMAYLLADSLKTTPAIYQGIKATPNVQRIVGVDVSEYGFQQAEQYVTINTESLFLLGQTKGHEQVLSSIALDSYEQTIITKYPIKGFFPIDEMSFTVFLLLMNSHKSPILL